MQSDFFQQSLLEKRWFQFTSNGLHVRYTRFMKSHEYELKYEDIGTKLIQIKKGVRGWLIPTIIFAILSVALLIDRLTGGNVERGAEWFYLVAALLCATGYYLTFDNCLYMAKANNVNPVRLMYNKPSREELETFLAEVKSRRRANLLALYGQLNRNLSYEHQYNNLTWLLNNDVLTADEFQEKLSLLDQSIPSQTKVTGFNISKG